MTKLFQKITLEKLGVFSFLLFFLFTPLLIKLRVAEDVYVEPLLPLLALGVLLILGSLRRKQGPKNFLRWTAASLFPNSLSVLYSFLIILLLISYFYGWALTGIPSSGDLLRVIKHLLYFLPLPLAIYAGRFLGTKDTRAVLMIFVAVGVAAAVASSIRVFDFLFSGGGIDFWTYRIYNRSVGFLGQYFDPLGPPLFGLTGKSAGATFGLYASVALAVSLAFTASVKKFKSWGFGLILVVAITLFGAILYTLSRGAVATGALVVGAWAVWSLRWKKVRVVSASLALLILSSIILVWINPQVMAKLASTFRFVEIPSPEVLNEVETEVVIDSSTMGRVEMWGSILRAFKTFPPLAVAGTGYHTPNLNFFTGVNITHSLFLDIWVRGGLMALAVLIAVWLSLFRFLFRFVNSRDRFVQALGFMLSGFAAGWFIDNLISGEQFFSDAPMIAFWGILGLTEALRLAARQEGGKKRILIALTSSDIGGAPKVVYDLLSSARKIGREEFEFVVAGPPGVFLKRFRELGYKVHSVRLDRISLRSFWGFLKVVRREGVDLINSHGKGAGLYARKAGFILNIPVVHTIHGIHYSKTNPVSRNFYLFSERILSAFTELVVNVSKNQEREGLSLNLFPKSKSRVVENGIEIKKTSARRPAAAALRKKIGIGKGDFAVAMVARFDPPGVKGHSRFIDLIPRLAEKISHLKIIFVGGGEGKAEAIRRVRELGTADSAIFLGERNDVPDILRAVDALVLPSYHEGMPLAVLEAAAASLPVIGSDVVGIKDAILEGRTGYLVDFDKPEEVLAAFRRLGRSVARRERMGERGRAFVEKEFSMGKFVDSTLKVYREALASG